MSCYHYPSYYQIAGNQNNLSRTFEYQRINNEIDNNFELPNESSTDSTNPTERAEVDCRKFNTLPTWPEKEPTNPTTLASQFNSQPTWAQDQPLNQATSAVKFNIHSPSVRKSWQLDADISQAQAASEDQSDWVRETFSNLSQDVPASQAPPFAVDFNTHSIWPERPSLSPVPPAEGSYTTESCHSMDAGNLPRKRRSRLGKLNPVFHKRDEVEDADAVPQFMLAHARKTGILKLHGKGLTTVPDKIYNANEYTDKLPELQALTVNEDEAWWNREPITTLDLSSNALCKLSPKIKNLDTLTTLNLYDNALTVIPKEIAALEKLTHVNLSRNKLQQLPEEFFTLPELRFLNLSYNALEELHPSVSDLHMLEHLDVAHNSLHSLPGGIGFLVRVTDLILSHNHILKLPADLVNMRNLQKLDLNNNNLTALPADMGYLRKLVWLYIQHNDIVKLPTFEGCECLQELYVGNNLIEKIPEKFYSSLPHLKILDLRDNKISKLSNDIALLTNLIRLDLTNNSLENLPLKLGSLAHLLSLQVDGNPIKSIRRDVLQCGTTRILRTLRDRARAYEQEAGNQSTTNPQGTTTQQQQPSYSSVMGADGLNSPRRPAGGNDETVFPDKYKLRNTHCLNVTMQCLTAMPEELFRTAAEENVSTIDLSKNSFEKLPEGLELLKSSASELVFANNQLTRVPSYLSQFTRLTLLNLSCNQLSELPREMGVLNTLRELNICNNRFESLPSCIFQTQNLEILLASDNRVKHIDATPQGLGALKRLAILDLRNNNIEQVPPILGNLKNIVTLELIGNPFRQPRHQILTKGTDAIMSYLRDRIPT